MGILVFKVWKRFKEDFAIFSEKIYVDVGPPKKHIGRSNLFYVLD
jgi:hypothetical protein